MDILKVKNSTTNGNDVQTTIQPQQKQSNGKKLETIQEQQQEQPRKNSNEVSLIYEEQQQPSGVVVTTKWETFEFDSTPPLITFPSTSTTTPSMNNNSGPPKFNWEFFE